MPTFFLGPVPAARPSPEPSAAGARRWRCHPRGFTLVELLVAMTVTMLLVVALMQIFNAAASTWQHGEAQVDAYREARGALQFMARDLSATLQADYSQPTTSNPATYAPVMPTLALQHYDSNYAPGDGPLNEEVYCLTNIPNSGAISGSSSLCAVGYFCQWMPDSMPVSSDGVDRRPRAFALMRQSLDSNGTFQRIQAAAGTSPLTFGNLFTRTNIPTQLAAYVWDLRFRIDTDLREANADGSLNDGNALPPNGPQDHSTPTRYYRGEKADQPYPPRLPAYVEIRFKALSDVAGRRLEGLGAGVTQATWNDTKPNFVPENAYRTVIQPNAQQFVLRVPLINSAP